MKMGSGKAKYVANSCMESLKVKSMGPVSGHSDGMMSNKGRKVAKMDNEKKERKGMKKDKERMGY